MSEILQRTCAIIGGGHPPLLTWHLGGDLPPLDRPRAVRCHELGQTRVLLGRPPEAPPGGGARGGEDRYRSAWPRPLVRRGGSGAAASCCSSCAKVPEEEANCFLTKSAHAASSRGQTLFCNPVQPRAIWETKKPHTTTVCLRLTSSLGVWPSVWLWAPRDRED